jgi:sulfite exporter TauE/SafE
MAYTYNKAKSKIYRNWFMGAAIALAASLSTIISTLKMFYFSLDGVDPFSYTLAQPIKRLVELIYQNTRFLEYFWIYSPQPLPKNIFTSQNVYFLAGYLMIFVGITLIASAKALSARLATINKQIENEMIKASVTGNQIRRRQEIQDSIPINKPELGC